ncbi:hypothetical protein [Marimonas lutisalis]|uniref:hypothetical protein n=1 Tax=Marimonas lutisalis TaxID=2545756 RepID=UPI001476DA22|nr:hypothetical protein [Marimonas lutisalis]
MIHDFDTGIWGSWHGCGWFFGAPSYGDVITLDVKGIDSFEDLMQHAEHKRGSVVFDLGEDDSLKLKGTRLHQLDVDDFIFV